MNSKTNTASPPTANIPTSRCASSAPVSTPSTRRRSKAATEEETMAENREHGGASHAMDKMQDAVGAVVGKMSAAMGGGASTEFVKNAALSDRYEIAAA